MPNKLNKTKFIGVNSVNGDSGPASGGQVSTPLKAPGRGSPGR